MLNNNCRCAVCDSDVCDSLGRIKCGGLKPDSIYNEVEVVCCQCGHIYNKLNKEEQNALIKYYKHEYAHENPTSAKQARDRYEILFNLFNQDINKDACILDIGCATGGFLSYLKDRGYDNLYGTEINMDYIEEAKKTGINIKHGIAESLPFDGKFDYVFSDQVVEHLIDPNLFFTEARRVLKPNGYLCVSVPDAAQYDECEFFEYYWFLIREHIQHFDEAHLVKLAEKHGFSYEKVVKSKTVMLSKKSLLPSINIVLKLNGAQAAHKNELIDFSLKRKTIEYFYKQSVIHYYRNIAIDSLWKTKRPIYVYGISREFMYLYENSNLFICNIRGFFDDTTIKQTKKVGDNLIQSGSELKNCKPGSVLITAFAHTEALAKKINEMGHSWLMI